MKGSFLTAKQLKDKYFCCDSKGTTVLVKPFVYSCGHHVDGDVYRAKRLRKCPECNLGDNSIRDDTIVEKLKLFHEMFPVMCSKVAEMISEEELRLLVLRNIDVDTIDEFEILDDITAFAELRDSRLKFVVDTVDGATADKARRIVGDLILNGVVDEFDVADRAEEVLKNGDVVDAYVSVPSTSTTRPVSLPISSPPTIPTAAATAQPVTTPTAVAAAGGAAPPQQPASAEGCVLIVWDFDHMRFWQATDIRNLYVKLVERLRSDGVLRGTEMITTAFGASQSFSDSVKAKALEDLGIEMRFVSGKKAEEADRQIEQYINEYLMSESWRPPSQRANVIVLITNDMDFNKVVQKLRKNSKTVYVVHDAIHDSVQEQYYKLFASQAVHIDELLPVRATPTSILNTTRVGVGGAPDDPGPPEERFEGGRVRNVRVDKNNLNYAEISGPHGEVPVFVHCRNVRGGELRDGQIVSYCVRMNPQKNDMLMAFNVVPTGEDTESLSSTRSPLPTIAAGVRPAPPTVPLPSQPPSTRGLLDGNVLSWRPDKHGTFFGFIQPQVEGIFSDNVFFHETDNEHLRGVQLPVGARVVFRAVENPMKVGQMKAIDVRRLADDGNSSQYITSAAPPPPSNFGVARRGGNQFIVGKIVRVTPDKFGLMCGFIRDTKHDEDIFFHQSDNPELGEIDVNDDVAFKCVPNPKKPGQLKATDGQKVRRGRIYSYGRDTKYGFIEPLEGIPTNAYFHIADNDAIAGSVLERINPLNRIYVSFYMVPNEFKGDGSRKAVITKVEVT